MFEGIPSYRPVPKQVLVLVCMGGAPSSFRVGNLGDYNEILGFVSRVVFDIRSHKKSLSARGRLGRCSGSKLKKV